MNWEEINRAIAKMQNETTELELLIRNMSKFDYDKWVKPYNV